MPAQYALVRIVDRGRMAHANTHLHQLQGRLEQQRWAAQQQTLGRVQR